HDWVLVQIDPGTGEALARTGGLERLARPFCARPDAALARRIAMLADWLLGVEGNDPIAAPLATTLLHAATRAAPLQGKPLQGDADLLERLRPAIDALRRDPAHAPSAAEAAAPGQPAAAGKRPQRRSDLRKPGLFHPLALRRTVPAPLRCHPERLPQGRTPTPLLTPLAHRGYFQPGRSAACLIHDLSSSDPASSDVVADQLVELPHHRLQARHRLVDPVRDHGMAVRRFGWPLAPRALGCLAGHGRPRWFRWTCKDRRNGVNAVSPFKCRPMPPQRHPRGLPARSLRGIRGCPSPSGQAGAAPWPAARSHGAVRCPAPRQPPPAWRCRPGHKRTAGRAHGSGGPRVVPAAPVPG